MSSTTICISRLKEARQLASASGEKVEGDRKREMLRIAAMSGNIPPSSTICAEIMRFA